MRTWGLCLIAAVWVSEAWAQRQRLSWEHPIPTGMTLTDVHAVAGTPIVYALGEWDLLKSTNYGLPGSWEYVFTPALDPTMESISCVDALQCWVADWKRVAFTTNGGGSWTTSSHVAQPNNMFNTVSFVDADVGWVTSSGSVLKTINGGVTWQEQPLPITCCLPGFSNWKSVIKMIDRTHGYVMPNQVIDPFYKTVDGENWTRVTLPTGGFYLFDAYDADRLMIAGNGIRFSLNGGDSWGSPTTAPADRIVAIDWVDQNTAYASAGPLWDGPFTIYKTTNASAGTGTQWLSQGVPAGAPTGLSVTSLSCSTPQHCVAVGRGGLVEVTVDGGSWGLGGHGFGPRGFTAISMAAPGIGAAVGDTDVSGIAVIAYRSPATDEFFLADYSSPPTQTLLAVTSASTGGNSADGWAVGLSGTIYTSQAATPALSLWSPVASGVTTDLTAVDHVSGVGNAAIVVAGGAGGVLLRTTNGGTTWSPVVSGTAQRINAIHFPSATNGWLVDQGGSVLKSSNGGVSWQPQDAGVALPYVDVYFVNDQAGFIAASNATVSKVLRTTNGGQSWSDTAALPIVPPLAKLFAADSQTIYALSGSVAVSTNGGLSWPTVNLVSPRTPVDLDGVPGDLTNVWLVAGAQSIMRSRCGLRDELLCDDGNVCTYDYCSERTGACVFEPTAGPLCPDAGNFFDAGLDAGPLLDAGSDAGTFLDAGVDAGHQTDAGTTLDSGIDAGAPFDGGSEFDAGMLVDSGVLLFDAGSVADSGTQMTEDGGKDPMTSPHAPGCGCGTTPSSALAQLTLLAIAIAAYRARRRTRPSVHS